MVSTKLEILIDPLRAVWDFINPFRNNQLSTENSFKFINLGLMVLFGLDWWIIYHVVKFQAGNEPKAWNLILVSLGAFSAGNIVGFLFSRFVGTEKDKFGNAFNVINTAVGTLALSDLVRQDSAIRTLFHNLSAACGNRTSSGVVLAVVSSFFSTGFLILYVNKTIVLNLLTSSIESFYETLDRPIEIVSKAGLPSAAKSFDEAEEEAELFKGNPDLQQAAEDLVKRVENSRFAPVDKIRANVKALILSNKLTQANSYLHSIVDRFPEDGELKYLQALTAMRLKDHPEAIRILTDLAKQPNAPWETWKLLGYAHLWDKSSINDSISCTQKYLQKYPDDLGAKLNLACAQGQKGPTDPARAATLKLVQEIIQRDPTYKRRITSLMAPGEDFEAWRNETDFLALLK